MLNLTKTLRVVRTDERSLQLQKLRGVKNPKTGEVRKEWIGTGWYGDLKSACKGALKKALFDSVDEGQNISTIIALIDNAETEIVNAIKERK